MFGVKGTSDKSKGLPIEGSLGVREKKKWESYEKYRRGGCFKKVAPLWWSHSQVKMATVNHLAVSWKVLELWLGLFLYVETLVGLDVCVCLYYFSVSFDKWIMLPKLGLRLLVNFINSVLSTEGQTLILKLCTVDPDLLLPNHTSVT